MNRSLIQLSVSNVNVKTEGKKPKQLLHDVSAVFKHSRVCAILGKFTYPDKHLKVGPSGAGKTILLSILAGQIASLRKMNIEGKIKINEEEIDDIRIMNLIAGFVQQEDILMGSMTVEEVLQMGIYLRRQHEYPIREELLIKQTLNQLGIPKIRKQTIGRELEKGISGGERKRVSIGLEMITNLSLLILDEPTAALDTFNQLLIARGLQRIARQGVTIIESIHGPSSEMLEYIDDILILAEGRICYHGTVNNLISYLNKVGYPCPQYVNPLDFVFLEVLHDKESDFTEYEHERVINLSRIYRESEEKNAILRQINQPPRGLITANMLKHRSGFIDQLKFLLPRELKNYIRSPMTIIARLFQTTFLAVFLALVYMDVYNGETAESIYQDVEGALFFIIINQAFTALNNSLNTFYEEKSVFLREYVAGFYSLPSYFLSKIIADLPFQILLPTITSFIVYWVIGFKSGFQHFLLFLVTLILVNLCGAALGLFCSATFSNPSIGIASSIIILLPLVIYGGFFVDSSNSPAWLAWLIWVSPIQYAFTAVALNEIGGRNVQGVLGDEELDIMGISGRFGVGLSLVFLVAIWLLLLLLTFIGLYNAVRKSGLDRYSTNKARAKVLNRKQ